MLVHGKADGRTFPIVRERLDVASALSVPLVSEGDVKGVLNLHHSTQREAFDENDLQFMERVARLDGFGSLKTAMSPRWGAEESPLPLKSGKEKGREWRL